jgi:hypothetical protein
MWYNGASYVCEFHPWRPTSRLFHFWPVPGHQPVHSGLPSSRPPSSNQNGISPSRTAISLQRLPKNGEGVVMPINDREGPPLRCHSPSAPLRTRENASNSFSVIYLLHNSRAPRVGGHLRRVRETRPSTLRLVTSLLPYFLTSSTPSCSTLPTSPRSPLGQVHRQWHRL